MRPNRNDKPSDTHLILWRNRQSAKIKELLLLKFSKLAKGQPPEVAKLLKAMEHTVKAGGKLLRPLFAMAAAEAIGRRGLVALPAALAAELIHSYTLIHDDLPALDNDDFRRGQPSCHAAFGEGVAILAGDALQSLAFETLAETGGDSRKDGRIVQATLILAKAIGAQGTVGGQVQDLSFETQMSLKLASYKDMTRRKTGELFAAALGMGAALAGSDKPKIVKLRRVGLLAGEAFQIADDLLNFKGDPKVMGKAVGTDAKRGKASILSFMSPQKAAALAEELQAQAKKEAHFFRSPKLDWLLDSIANRSA
jgi:geranylgeranyl diphosphate synthase type II